MIDPAARGTQDLMKLRLAAVLVLSSACAPGDPAAEVGADATESDTSSGDESEPTTGYETGPGPDTSNTESESESETGSEVPPSGPPIPIDPDAPPIVYFVGDEVWRIAADGTGAAPIGLTIAVHGGSAALHYGTSFATVSPDGRRLAYLAPSGDVMVAAIDGDVVETHMALDIPVAVWVSAGITTWSPDSSTVLAFARQDGQDEGQEPPPVPPDFLLGTYVIDAETMTATHTEQVWGWLAWAGSSDVLLDASVGESTQLLRYSLAGGEPTFVHEVDDVYGFLQLHVAGERMVWNAAGLDGDQSQVMFASLLGDPALSLGPKLGWADIVFPRLAPTVDRVFVTIDDQGTIVEGMGEPQAIPLAFWVDTRWESDQHLLGVTDAGLVRVDIHGNTTILDPAATALPIQ
jgi:hypothetical protein